MTSSLTTAASIPVKVEQASGYPVLFYLELRTLSLTLSGRHQGNYTIKGTKENSCAKVALLSPFRGDDSLRGSEAKLRLPLETLLSAVTVIAA